MVARGTEPRNKKAGRAGNGRTPAENSAYAKVAQAGMSREQMRANAEAARAGRRRKAAERVIALNGELPPGELERAIDLEIAAQMARIRAKALTTRRRARQVAERAAELEAEAAALDRETGSRQDSDVAASA